MPIRAAGMDPLIVRIVVDADDIEQPRGAFELGPHPPRQQIIGLKVRLVPTLAMPSGGGIHPISSQRKLTLWPSDYKVDGWSKPADDRQTLRNATLKTDLSWLL